ncbi:DUF2268 domain-containing putative Zn-dependent protease [Marilutibacter chinensis]|uniref:DUF2268 domain-containing protein n=1 Tax=Marilutibacter chinensis TaxID=2912247 RepID=A0ABS9HPZ9_9GAMM|nr:DUF2268 domain-containing putative Zn-dependent protease [Lysobacter chinensis]MCF7220718.1 DUF2268 domain-containing protein [Lysobacter chinensis]
MPATPVPMVPVVVPPQRALIERGGWTRSVGIASHGLLVLAALACPATAAFARDAASTGPAAPAVVIEDVERFYRIYDAAGRMPDAGRLQRDYLDPGSDGLHHFARLRRVTGEAIAATLDKRPELYEQARSCMRVMPQVKQRLGQALNNLATRYPEANLPPVTIVVGRGKPVGIGYPDSGLQIGLEALCAVDWMNPDLEDRFVHVIAHEYAHVQLAPESANLEQATVLERSLMEGAAEFAAELISGSTAYAHFDTLTLGREKEIETAFQADVDKTDLGAWLDNSSAEKPGDLGYWVGYRIVKAYYLHADDKRRAFRELLRMEDPEAFFAASGWYPGIEFEE